MSRIGVLASGGLDSAVLVADKACDAEVFPIYVQCGLAWEPTAYQALQSFLTALKNPKVMPLTLLSVPIGAMYGHHWSVPETGFRVWGNPTAPCSCRAAISC